MYLALYRKYRPKIFDDVISQEHITLTLKNQISSGETAHAYLFTGSRGTGKTSCAKILAKALNCLSPIDGNPCGKCAACIEIEKGATDITEMDAASNNGVDDVRSLREEVMYTPVSLKKRVYIIDEVHMLSTSAFNALLKTLEEPPAHVVFILATTELHKVPATILSRCQRFEFHRIDIRDSAELLVKIAHREDAEIDFDAALLISRLSDGGMRDAISLLDQCISAEKKVSLDTVKELANITDKSWLFSLSDALISKNSAVALDILDKLYNSSKDITRLFEELVLHFRNLMLIKLSADNKSINLPEDEFDYLKNQADSIMLNEIMQIISSLQEYLIQFSSAKNRKVLAEICLVKLSSPKLSKDIDALINRIEALEEKISLIEKNGVAITKKPNDNADNYQKTDEVYFDKNDISTPSLTDCEDVLAPEPEAISLGTTEGLSVDNKLAGDEGISKPLPQWKEIIEDVPPYISSLLIDSKAEILDNKVIIHTQKALLRNCINNPADEGCIALKKQIEKHLGINVVLTCSSQNEIKEEKDKLDLILQKAKALGCKLYIKNN